MQFPHAISQLCSSRVALFRTHVKFIRRLLGVSGSKANLHRHRGNHMQTLTILGSTVKSPVDICPAGNPTPAKPEVVFFSGAIAVRFFSRGEGRGAGGGRVFGTPSFRPAFTQSALLHFRNRFQPIQGCLQDAQNPSKLPPKGRQDPSNYIIHAKLVSSSCFNSSFIPLPSF